ncbi:MAG: hypothetical protein AAGF32_09665 [Pseudomonadota bacterium]
MLNWFSKMVDRWTIYWVCAGLLLGGIIHIVTIFALPVVATSSAWERLKQLTTPNQLYVYLGLNQGPAPIPLMAPDIRYAICRFDVSDGPVRVTTQFLDGTWSIALYSTQSANFYTITGLDLKRKDLTMILNRATDGSITTPVAEGAKTSTVTVAVPETQGLLMLRAPVRSQAYELQTNDVLQSSSCGPLREQTPAPGTGADT